MEVKEAFPKKKKKVKNSSYWETFIIKNFDLNFSRILEKEVLDKGFIKGEKVKVMERRAYKQVLRSIRVTYNSKLC